MKSTFMALLAFSLCLPLVAADKKTSTNEESAKIDSESWKRQAEERAA